MNGDEFIEFAGKLAARTRSDAATCRTATSRAYYGAFHTARALLRELGYIAPTLANVHVFVQHYLIGSGQSDAQRAGRFLGELHSDRIKADYRIDLLAVEDPRFAQASVELAHRCLSALRACEQEPARTEIRLGIDEYHRKRVP